MYDTRIDWLDRAKGIGIILVVFGHVLIGLSNSNIIDNKIAEGTLRSIIYSFHMPLFFLLAGTLFFGALQRQSSSQIFANKLDILIYPYLVWSILQGGIELVLVSQKNNGLQLSEVLSLLWQPRAHFWFLYELFIFSIICSFCCRRSWQTVVIAIVALCLYCSGDWGNSINIIRYFKHNFLFFVIGILAAPLILSLKFSHRALATVFILFIFSQFIFHETLQLYFLDKSLLSLMLALLGCLFIFGLAQIAPHSKPAQLLSLLGKHSLAIYLIHVIALAAVRILLMRVFGIDDWLLHLTIGTIAGITLPLLISLLAARYGWHFLFKAPLSRALKIR